MDPKKWKGSEMKEKLAGAALVSYLIFWWFVGDEEAALILWAVVALKLLFLFLVILGVLVVAGWALSLIEKQNPPS